MYYLKGTIFKIPKKILYIHPVRKLFLHEKSLFSQGIISDCKFLTYRVKSTKNQSVYILLASIATSYDKPVYDIFGNSTLHKFKPFDTGIVIWHRLLQFVTASWLLGIDLCLL